MLKSNNIKKGFTIIEVIIVLVIAAIIMVMVFLVVPQLQQSQRNTRRQNYARQVLSAINQWYSSNPGSDFSALTAANQKTAIEGIAGVFKDPTTGGVSFTFKSDVTGTASSSLGSIMLQTGGTKCSGATYASGGSGASVIIAIEPSTTWCVADAN